MKTSPLLISIFCVVALLASGTIAWQAWTIRSMHKEEAALHQDLRTALAGWLEKAATSVTNSSEGERSELVKLRHETRQLRESLADARATRPGSVQGLIRAVLPERAATPFQIRPEWKGLEKHLTNNYAWAMAGVTNGTNEYVRFLRLAPAAKASFAMGLAAEASEYAADALTLNDKYSRGSPEKVNGAAVHDANVVLGRIALQEGHLEDAKRHLLAAAQDAGSNPLSSTPNLGLAKDLLERGEQATVLKYFQLCRRFWREKEKLALWKEDIEEGRMPDLQAYVIN
jgi:hypothetical protein